MTTATMTFLALLLAGCVLHVASGVVSNRNLSVALQNAVTLCIGGGIASFTWMFLEGTLSR